MGSHQTSETFAPIYQALIREKVDEIADELGRRVGGADASVKMTWKTQFQSALNNVENQIFSSLMNNASGSQRHPQTVSYGPGAIGPGAYGPGSFQSRSSFHAGSFHSASFGNPVSTSLSSTSAKLLNMPQEGQQGVSPTSLPPPPPYTSYSRDLRSPAPCNLPPPNGMDLGRK